MLPKFRISEIWNNEVTVVSFRLAQHPHGTHQFGFLPIAPLSLPLGVGLENRMDLKRHFSSLRVLSAQIRPGFCFILWNYTNIIGEVEVYYSIECKFHPLKPELPSTPWRSLVFLFLILSSVKINFLYQTFTEHALCTSHPRYEGESEKPHSSTGPTI